MASGGRPQPDERGTLEDAALAGTIALGRLLWAARLMEGHARITHERLGDRGYDDCHGANYLRDALAPFQSIPGIGPPERPTPE